MQTQHAPNTHSIKCCSKTEIEVKRKDLPVRCPTPDMSLWNGHPRVYLELDNNNEAMCPYCGTHFKVVD